MSQDNRPKILAYDSAGAEGALWPGPVVWRITPGVPSRRELLAEAWDYCYFGFDCEILDCRLFQLAAEYAAQGVPDLMVFSSPVRQIPSGKYDRPEECFHILCELAAGGGLYTMGNKLFSRRLIEETDSLRGTEFLGQAFRRITSVAALAQPWVEVREVASPDDGEFFAFVEHFSGAGDKEGAAWK